MAFLRPAAFALVVLALAYCKKTDEGPALACTDTQETPECQPPDFTSPAPQGKKSPPALEDALAAETAADKASATVLASGATLTMSNGVRVDVPVGALPVGATLTAYRYDDSPTIYRFTSSVPLAGKVDVTFPMPGITAATKNTDVYVLWFHDAGDPEPLQGAIDATAKTLKVSTTRFSSAVPVDAQPKSGGGTGDRLSRMPYYNQGQTQNCWSMALLMLLNGYGGRAAPWDNNAFFQLAAEHGLKFWTYQHSESMVTYIKSKVPGVEVERQSWWTGFGADNLRAYLTDNMRAGRPTLVWYESPALHMVLFVGIEGDKFVIHDPAQGVYVRQAWTDITPHFKVTVGFNGTGTLALDKPVPPLPWKASLVVPYAAARNNGVDFIATKPDGKFDTASALVFAWYIQALKGPGLLDLSTTLPGNLTKRHRAFAAVNVTNIVDGSQPTTFNVGFEIASKDGAVVYHHPEATVTLAAGQDQDVALVSGRGKAVSDLVSQPGDYRATFYVAEGATRFDTESLPFVVDKDAQPLAQSDCSALTDDFRSHCGTQGGCMCIGNAFCEGFFSSGGGSCRDASLGCLGDCLLYAHADCECDRYCNMFLARISCGP